MFKNVIPGILFLVSVNSFAQQGYFIIIQSDSNQGFYAMLNGKAFSSSDNGRLIIPNLKDSSYELGIGFPNEKYPEQKFVITVSKKDQSFQLKNLGEKGWSLLNPVNSEIQFPEKKNEIASSKPISSGPTKKDDAFSRLMAGVVNDTSVMYTTVIEEEPQKEVEKIKSEKLPTPKKDSSVGATVKQDKNKIAKNIKPPASPPVVKNRVDVSKSDSSSKVAEVKQIPLYRTKDTAAVAKHLSFTKKIAEQKTDSATSLVYVDIWKKGGIDTIDVEIPNEKVKEPVLAKTDTIKNELPAVVEKEMKPVADSFQSTSINSQKELFRQNQNIVQEANKKADSNAVQQVAMNKNCLRFATDNDIDKLRLKILSIDNDDDRIAAARTVYKLKCFSVQQVKALSEAFKTDEGKYKLFDATYQHVSDVGNFAQLQDLLTDAYYINRFKAMMR